MAITDNFMDMETDLGRIQSDWVRLYGRYIEHKLMIVRTFDVQLEADSDKLLDMDYDRLFSALKVGSCGWRRRRVVGCDTRCCQALLAQLALLLDFEPRMQLLDNAITVTSFSLLLRDSMTLYAALMRGFLRVTNEYTEMCKREVQEAADLYERFVDLSEKTVDSFYPKCKRFTAKLPDFDAAPESMLRELDKHAKTAPDKPPQGRKARLAAMRDAGSWSVLW